MTPSKPDPVAALPWPDSLDDADLMAQFSILSHQLQVRALAEQGYVLVNADDLEAMGAAIMVADRFAPPKGPARERVTAAQRTLAAIQEQGR